MPFLVFGSFIPYLSVDSRLTEINVAICYLAERAPKPHFAMETHCD